MSTRSLFIYKLLKVNNINRSMIIKRFLEEYYNKETYTLTVPCNFNSLLKDLSLGTKITMGETTMIKWFKDLFYKIYFYLLFINFYFNLWKYIFIIHHKNIIKQFNKNKTLNCFIIVVSPNLDFSKSIILTSRLSIFKSCLDSVPSSCIFFKL